MGRLIDFKGFGDLIAACAELRQQEIAVDCEIAGDGPLRGTLEELIREHRLEGSVRLAGLLPQAEIRRRMQTCDVFALACRADERGACDVLPTVILEAMAAGRPVVSTTIAGVPEMVADDQTGLIAEPGDIGALADALAILTDRPMRERMGRAGRERWKAHFTSAAAGARLRELFNRQPLATHPPAEAPGGIVAIIPQWPPADGAPRELREALPGLRIVALTSLPRPALSAADGVEAFEFLPDAMAVEAGWRESPALAHRLESWRAELGGAVESEAFLLDARRALCLHQQLSARGTVRHLHALGSGALLVCWLAARLGGSTASFAVERAPSSLLRKLAGGFVGGWTIGELPDGLGPGFVSGEGRDHATHLRQWAANGGS